jgi:large subunit ribosomal protein L4
MEVTVYNQKGEKAGTIELPKELFEVKMNSDLVYQVAVTQAANRRQVTANTKGRGEVSGGGKKPWRQKGTGRSRHGSIRSPIWRHGGVVFGPTKDKVYGGKINKKMRRKALAMVLSAKAADNSLIMLDSLEASEPKTKQMAQVLKDLKTGIENFKEGKVLIATPGYDRNLMLAGRNLAQASVIEASKLNILDLLNVKYLVMPQASLGVIAQMPQISAEDKEIDAKKEKAKPTKRKLRPAKTKK